MFVFIQASMYEHMYVFIWKPESTSFLGAVLLVLLRQDLVGLNLGYRWLRLTGQQAPRYTLVSDSGVIGIIAPFSVLHMELKLV